MNRKANHGYRPTSRAQAYPRGRSQRWVARLLKAGKLLLALLVGLVLGFLLICWLLYEFLTGGLCDNHISQEVYSPNGQYKVVVFERNCGATTPYSTQIALLKSHISLGDRGGNLLVAEGHPDWFEIKVEWRDDKHLTIEYDAELDPGPLKRRIRGIDVQYIENP